MLYKILEHIVLNNMIGILVPHQHGFRKGLSRNTQVFSATQCTMNEVHKGHCVKAAALDFSKAFDKVTELAVAKNRSIWFL
jgi:hypothetical protein